MRPVDEREVERADGQIGENVVRAADVERHARRVDPALVARIADAAFLLWIGGDDLVLGPTRSEHDRARPRTGLERRHSLLDVLLEPRERLPREAPVVGTAVQARRRALERVGEGVFTG